MNKKNRTINYHEDDDDQLSLQINKNILTRAQLFEIFIGIYHYRCDERRMAGE